MTPSILLLGGGLALLALIPTRRLFLAGWPPPVLSAYFVVLWLLSFLAALAPGALRLLVPVLLLAWLAPWVTPRAGLARLRGRTPASAPRNVTPPVEGTTPRDEAPRGR